MNVTDLERSSPEGIRDADARRGAGDAGVNDLSHRLLTEGAAATLRRGRPCSGPYVRGRAVGGVTGFVGIAGVAHPRGITRGITAIGGRRAVGCLPPRRFDDATTRRARP